MYQICAEHFELHREVTLSEGRPAIIEQNLEDRRPFHPVTPVQGIRIETNPINFTDRDTDRFFLGVEFESRALIQEKQLRARKAVLSTPAYTRDGTLA